MPSRSDGPSSVRLADIRLQPVAAVQAPRDAAAAEAGGYRPQEMLAMFCGGLDVGSPANSPSASEAARQQW